MSADRLRLAADALTDGGVAANVNMIRETLHLTITDLARVLGRPRQAVYKWLAGDAQAERATQTSIARLAEIARLALQAGIARPELVLRIAIRDGQTVLDLFTNEELRDEDIDLAIHEVVAGQRAHGRPRDQRSDRSRADDWAITESIPGGREPLSRARGGGVMTTADRLREAADRIDKRCDLDAGTFPDDTLIPQDRATAALLRTIADEYEAPDNRTAPWVMQDTIAAALALADAVLGEET